MKTLACLTLLIAIFTSHQAQAEWTQIQTNKIQAWMYEPQNPRSVMLNLHGCTQHAADLKERGNWEAAAEKYGMVVVIPDVPNGGVVMGCWDYYGMDHTVKNKHNGPLIELTETVLKQKKLNTAFVSGLSSGAGEAMVLGCLRPDLFVGMALNASPAVGTEMAEISRPRADAEQIAENCKTLAKGRSFDKQNSSILHGNQDYIVNLKHSELIQDALIQIYDLKSKREIDPQSLPGSFPNGRGEVFADSEQLPRLSVYANDGLGHAWPAGNGLGMTMKYINPKSLDYPMYLGEFFTERVSGDKL